MAFIRSISSEHDDLSGGGLVSFGSMVPNDKNVYLIIAMSGSYYANPSPHMKVVDAYNNKYFDWMPDDAQHDADIFFSPNSVINSKSIMHIGDGTYNDTTGHYSSEFFNSSNIYIGEVGYYPFDKCLKDNISYILIDTGNNIHSNNDYPYIRGDHTQVLSFRLSQPAGVLDVQHNGTSITDENGVAEIGDVAYISDVNNVQTTLQSNFQAGVDSVYNACVSKGSTPASHSLTDVVNGILAIPQGGGGGMELGHSIAEEVYLPKTDAYSTLVAAVTVTTIAEENQT